MHSACGSVTYLCNVADGYDDTAAIYDGLTIYIGRQKLYYADAAETGGKVGELSTDGTAHRVLIRDIRSKPRAVVFDDDNR